MAATTRSLGSMSLFLRGFDHESALQAHHDIEHGDELILLREPENRHDQNAVRATDSEDRFVGRVAREHAKSFSAMLLALSSTGIRAEAVVAQFKDKGGWKNTEVYFDVTFITDSVIFENELSALKSIMQKYDDLDFRPVAFKTNTTHRPMAAPAETRSTTIVSHPAKRIKTTCSSPSLDVEALSLHQYLMKSIGGVAYLEGCEEESLFRGISWRLVGTSLVFNSIGKVTRHDGEMVYRLFFQQIGQHPMHADWTRIVKRTKNKYIKTTWIGRDGKIIKSIDDLETTINKYNMMK